MERRALGDGRPGGNPAFEQMVADHLRVVYRTAVRLAGRTQDAEDLVVPGPCGVTTSCAPRSISPPPLQFLFES